MFIKKGFLKMEQAAGDNAGADNGLGNRLNSSEGAFDDDYIPNVNNNNNQEGEGEGEGGNQSEENKFKPSLLWDSFSSLPDFKLPDNITAENEEELIRPFIQKKYGFEEKSIHPFASKVNDILSENPNITIADVFDKINNGVVDMSRMSDIEVLRHNFIKEYGLYDEETNPDGITEDDINAEIENMTTLAKKSLAKKIREENISEANKSVEEYNSIQQKKLEEELERKKIDMENSFNLILADISKKEDIYGIKISQSEIDNYMSEFKEFVTPDKESGISKMARFLSNDTNIFNAWFLLLKNNDQSIKELLTETRESAKLDIFKKLGLSDTSLGGSRGANDLNNTEISNRLSSADGTYK